MEKLEEELPNSKKFSWMKRIVTYYENADTIILNNYYIIVM